MNHFFFFISFDASFDDIDWLLYRNVVNENENDDDDKDDNDNGNGNRNNLALVSEMPFISVQSNFGL